MEVIVFVLIKVSYDYHRFEEYIGTFLDYKDLVRQAEAINPEYPIFEMENPVGMTEKAGVPPHFWAVPTKFYITENIEHETRTH